MGKQRLNIKNKKIENEILKIFKGIDVKSVSNSFRFYNEKFKIVVFTPQDNAEELILRMSSAGAGVIGNYTVCSFRSCGVGTFLGNEKSNPRVGKKQRLETVDECRIEMICEKNDLEKVIDQIYLTHPYEEPAIDIYPILAPVRIKSDKIFRFGLSREIPIEKLINNINTFLKAGVPDIPDLHVDQVIIDYSGGNFIPLNKRGKPSLLIKRNKQITNIELV
jgi:hypothetical protein